MTFDTRQEREQMELWKVIEEAPNYLISNFGRVKNERTGRILKGNNRDYPSVTLCFNGSCFTRAIHILVASAFVPGKAPGLEVNHKDRDPRNNRANNLEWLTRTQNMEHAVRTGMRKLKRWIVNNDYTFQEV